MWADDIPLRSRFQKLFRITLLPNGSVATHWDHSTLSWSISFRRLLKEGEISEFQQLLHLLSQRQVVDSMDRRIWSLKPSNKFSVKSLVNHFPASSSMTRETYKVLWKSNNPRRVNILVWIMIFGLLNCFLVMQRKLPNSCLLPSLFPLWRRFAASVLLSIFS